MANVDRPNGLRPVKHLNGAPYNGQVNMYLIPSSDSTAVFRGDLVKLAGGAGAAGTVVYGIDCEGIPTAIQSAAGDTHVGVVVGFLANQSDLSTQYRVASTDRIALVADAKDIIFEIQEVSGGTPLTADAVGLNANVVVGAGNTTTGTSGVELDNSTEATTADLDVQIMGLVKRVDNNYGEHAKWLVRINDHAYGEGVAGV